MGGNKFAFVLMVGLVGCAPTPGTEMPVLQGGGLEHAVAGTPPPRTASGRVLNSPLYDDGETFWVRLRFASAYDCISYQRASRTLVVNGAAAPISIPVQVGFAECDLSAPSPEVAFPLRDFRTALTAARGGDASLNLYAEYVVVFPDDGIADRVDADGNPIEAVGPVNYRIYLSERRPGVRPRVANVQPLPPAPAPGWDLDVSPVDLEAYVSLEGVIPPDHYVAPHVGVSWTFTQPMAFVHVEGRPRGAARSDRGTGLEYPEIATVLGAGTRYPNLSDTGMVPGAIYDVRVRGEDGLSDLLAPASVSTDGAALEPPVAFDVPLDSPVRSADTRFSFRVSPVRIEAPSRARPVGFATILPATTRIDAVLRPETLTAPVPSDARIRVRVRRRADGVVLIESDAGL